MASQRFGPSNPDLAQARLRVTLAEKKLKRTDLTAAEEQAAIVARDFYNAKIAKLRGAK